MFPQMPLMLQENFTVKLLEMLRTGELDCGDHGRAFPRHGSGDRAACTTSPSWWPCAEQPSAGARARHISSEELKQRNHAAAWHRSLLPRPRARGLPGVRPLFESMPRAYARASRGQLARDHQAHGQPPAWASRWCRSSRCLPHEPSPHLALHPRSADPVPTRRVVLAWRRTFTRYEAIAALRNADLCLPELPGVKRLTA